jgi:multidrug efflux pump subunit AcrB
VGENVYEYRERGMDQMTAAIRGSQDVARPVTFSILTNIVAFLPVLFLPGVTGNYWWPLPVVVITVLLFSLGEALFILPAHLGHIGRRAKNVVGNELHSWHNSLARATSNWIKTRYQPFLDLCLRHRYITLTASVVILVVTGGYAWSDHMGMVLMPQLDADEIEAGVFLPVGTTQDQAAAVAKRVTDASLRMFEEHDLELSAEGIKTNVRGQTFIDVEIVMKPPGERILETPEVIDLWRREIGDIEGVDQITFEAERGPGSFRPDISIDLSHANIDTLARASEALFERLEAFEDTRDVNDNYDPGKSQLNFTLLPEGRALGLTPMTVGRQVRDAFFGAIALRHLRGTNEIEVRVKLPEDERKDMRFLDEFVVRTPNGVEVPLMSVVEVTPGEAFRSLTRRDGRRVITVSAKVEPKSAANGILRIVREELLPQLRADFPGLTWSFEGSQAEMRESTATLWGGFALAMAVIYALLAIAFGSYIQPLIVMMSIPFGIVGAVLGHIILGYDLSLVSMMGVVAVSGVVVNGALIMVHHANRNREEMSAYDAIHEAGLRRFRPIVLTTLTTFGGLTPIIMETSRQAFHLIPMAISLGFGIVFATSIMLVVVPCLYMILEDLKQLAGQDSGAGEGMPSAS